MAEVKILIKGYLSSDSPDGGICPTITLIKDNGKNIIVDPGVVIEQNKIIESLKSEGLQTSNIDYIFITHSHLDHYRNIGMFPQAKSLEFWGIWDKNKEENWNENFSNDIKIIKTPGHNYDSLTFLVKTNMGIIAICGDVFWKENFPEIDKYATNKEKLEESRKKVLSMANFIIPGHGNIYKINN